MQQDKHLNGPRMTMRISPYKLMFDSDERPYVMVNFLGGTTLSEPAWEKFQMDRRDQLISFLNEYLNLHAYPDTNRAYLHVINFPNQFECDEFVMWHKLTHEDLPT